MGNKSVTHSFELFDSKDDFYGQLFITKAHQLFGITVDHAPNDDGGADSCKINSTDAWVDFDSKCFVVALILLVVSHVLTPIHLHKKTRE